jgi:hypothetical protein
MPDGRDDPEAGQRAPAGLQGVGQVPGPAALFADGAEKEGAEEERNRQRPKVDLGKRHHHEAHKPIRQQKDPRQQEKGDEVPLPRPDRLAVIGVEDPSKQARDALAPLLSVDEDQRAHHWAERTVQAWYPAETSNGTPLLNPEDAVVTTFAEVRVPRWWRSSWATATETLKAPSFRQTAGDSPSLATGW